MTIRVTIKNNENEGGRTIKVMIVNRPRTNVHPIENFGGEVKPGCSAEFYVHAAQHLIVEEQV